MLLFLLIFSNLSFANVSNDCDQVDKDYILGNYKACASSQEGSSSIRCRYLKAVCSMADSSYDSSRYELSLISADVKSGKFGEFNGLALTSLAEIAFLQGDYKRAKTLSSAVKDLLVKRLPSSYPYSISEVLTTKSYFEAKELAQANKGMDVLKRSHMDNIMFSSLDPWQ
ncbi:MAG: hypothetical protein WCQ53_05950 [bacterium]